MRSSLVRPAIHPHPSSLTSTSITTSTTNVSHSQSSVTSTSASSLSVSSSSASCCSSCSSSTGTCSCSAAAVCSVCGAPLSDTSTSLCSTCSCSCTCSCSACKSNSTESEFAMNGGEANLSLQEHSDILLAVPGAPRLLTLQKRDRKSSPHEGTEKTEGPATFSYGENMTAPDDAFVTDPMRKHAKDGRHDEGERRKGSTKAGDKVSPSTGAKKDEGSATSPLSATAPPPLLASSLPPPRSSQMHHASVNTDPTPTITMRGAASQCDPDPCASCAELRQKLDAVQRNVKAHCAQLEEDAAARVSQQWTDRYLRDRLGMIEVREWELRKEIEEHWDDTRKVTMERFREGKITVQHLLKEKAEGNAERERILEHLESALNRCMQSQSMSAALNTVKAEEEHFRQEILNEEGLQVLQIEKLYQLKPLEEDLRSVTVEGILLRQELAEAQEKAKEMEALLLREREQWKTQEGELRNRAMLALKLSASSAHAGLSHPGPTHQDLRVDVDEPVHVRFWRAEKEARRTTGFEN